MLTPAETVEPLAGHCPGGNVSNGVCTPFTNEQRSTWMSHYASARQHRIADCTLPGTHNSGMDKEADYVRDPETCQDRSPLRQLLTGIRVLDLRVRHYSGIGAGLPDRFRIFHRDDSGRTIKEDILDAVLEFQRHSPSAGDPRKEIIILDFHQFNDFDDAAHHELAQLIKTKLGPALVPPWMNDLSIGQIWNMGTLNVVIAYNATPRDIMFWKGVNQRWIGRNVVSSDELKRFMDTVAAEEKPQDELRSIQSAKYVQTFPIPVPDDISSSLADWFWADDPNSFINKFFIINTDWSMRQRLIDNCIHSNTLKARGKAAILYVTVPQATIYRLPSGQRAIVAYVGDGHWAEQIYLPFRAPEHATVVITHQASYDSRLAMDSTDLQIGALVMKRGDVIALTYRSNHWVVLKQTDVAQSGNTVIRTPERYEKVTGYTQADGQWESRFSLPANAQDGCCVLITSVAGLASTLIGSNLVAGADMRIDYGFEGAFVFDSAVAKWAYSEINSGNPDLPIPANFHLDDPYAERKKLLWHPSARAVKYKVYRWFDEITETTGTEYLTTQTGYQRWHVRAVDAHGKQSARTPYLYFTNPEL